jgi:hypothetical protein
LKQGHQPGLGAETHEAIGTSFPKVDVTPACDMVYEHLITTRILPAASPGGRKLEQFPAVAVFRRVSAGAMAG